MKIALVSDDGLHRVGQRLVPICIFYTLGYECKY
jgi:hypothetical protein